jgi:hypothetical protein
MWPRDAKSQLQISSRFFCNEAVPDAAPAGLLASARTGRGHADLALGVWPGAAVSQMTLRLAAGNDVGFTAHWFRVFSSAPTAVSRHVICVRTGVVLSSRTRAAQSRMNFPSFWRSGTWRHAWPGAPCGVR